MATDSIVRFNISYSGSPIVPLTFIGPNLTITHDSVVDSGAGISVISSGFAKVLGIKWGGKPDGSATFGNASSQPYWKRRLTLRLSDGSQAFEWGAQVAIIELSGGQPASMRRRPLIGWKAGLQYFDFSFASTGTAGSVEFTPNSNFLGIHQSAK